MSDIHRRFDQVTRVEIIDGFGRTYASHNAQEVWVALQDDGKTLKIFHTGDTSHGTTDTHHNALIRDLTGL